MKFAIGGISHETNTFSPIRTTRDLFDIHTVDLLDHFRDTNTGMGGAIAVAERHGIDVAPTLYASATPSGLVAAEAYAELKLELLERLRAALPVDAVLLCLHGAMVVEDIPDGEGDVLAAVRAVVGPDVPVVVTLDLHGNITRESVSSCNAIYGYETNPHIDMADRAIEAGEAALRILDGRLRPTMGFARLPMMPPTINMRTTEGPLAETFALAREAERRPGVENISLFGGFPFCDRALAGTSVVTVTNGDQHLADDLAQEFAATLWGKRLQFLKPLISVDEAVRRAMTAPRGPVILADVADNPGGGGSGDGTVILAALLQAGARETAFAMINDPDVVREAQAAGIGATIQTTLGAKIDTMHGSPLPLTAYVRVLTDGAFTNRGPQGHGLRVSVGPTALLVSGGVEIIVTSRRHAPNDPEIFRSVGIDPTARQILVVKSRGHFRAAYEPFAAEIIEVDAPGVASPDLSRFTYTALSRTIWPLDPETIWP